MSTSFSITAASSRLSVDGGHAVAVFTVINELGREVRARAVVRTDDGAEPSWFTVRGEPERSLAPDGVHRYEVEVRPPPGTSAGRHAFWLVVQDVDEPDEHFEVGQRVQLEIPAGAGPAAPPKGMLPWWALVAGAVGLVVITAVVVFLIARRGGDALPPIAAQQCPEGDVMVGIDDRGTIACAEWSPGEQMADLEQTVTTLRGDHDRLQAQVDSLERRVPLRTWKISQNGPNDPADSGPLDSRRLVIDKQRDDTVLRVAYYDNLRTMGVGASRWEIRVDGNSVSTGPIFGDVYLNGPNHHRPSSVVGYVPGLPKGRHFLQVYIVGVPDHPGVDAHTGWEGSTWTLEVQELWPEP